jgi:hypothetical protein
MLRKSDRENGTLQLSLFIDSLYLAALNSREKRKKKKKMNNKNGE